MPTTSLSDKNEHQILDAVKDWLENQNNNWRFIHGMHAYSAKELIKKIDTDRNLRELIVTEVTKLSVDIFMRGKPSKLNLKRKKRTRKIK